MHKASEEEVNQPAYQDLTFSRIEPIQQPHDVMTVTVEGVLWLDCRWMTACGVSCSKFSCLKAEPLSKRFGEFSCALLLSPSCLVSLFAGPPTLCLVLVIIAQMRKSHRIWAH